MNLNKIDDNEKQLDFLKQHVEDVNSFLIALEKVNKKKITLLKQRPQKKHQQKNKIIEVKITTDEVFEIFHNKKKEQILEEYKLNDLKQMYYVIYKRFPTSSYNKNRIVSTIKNYIYAMDRIDGFNELEIERNKNLE